MTDYASEEGPGFFERIRIAAATANAGAEGGEVNAGTPANYSGPMSYADREQMGFQLFGWDEIDVGKLHCYDNEEGNELEAELVKGDHRNAEWGIGTAKSGYKDDGQTAEVGAQLSVAEASINSDEADEASDQDEVVARSGLSLGIGAAGRFHHGDADNDGARELGLGIDAGPVSFDFKSETAGRVYDYIFN